MSEGAKRDRRDLREPLRFVVALLEGGKGQREEGETQNRMVLIAIGTDKGHALLVRAAKRNKTPPRRQEHDVQRAMRAVVMSA